MKKSILICSIVILAIGTLIYLYKEQVFTKMILRMTGDYATPKYENDAGILTKTRNENLYYDRLYKLKDYKSFRELQQKKIAEIPFVQIYNKDKKMLSIGSGSECRWELMNFFAKQDSFNLVAGDSLMYNFVLDRLAGIDIKINEDTFKYYILAGWANFVPKLSGNLFKQTNEMKKSLGSSVCFSYIDLDYQESWKPEMASQ